MWEGCRRPLPFHLHGTRGMPRNSVAYRRHCTNCLALLIKLMKNAEAKQSTCFFYEGQLAMVATYDSKKHTIVTIVSYHGCCVVHNVDDFV